MRKNANTQRELATHATEIKHLQADMDKMVEDMKQVKLCLQEIKSTLSEARGGLRVLIGAGAAAGGIVASLLHWFRG